MKVYTTPILALKNFVMRVDHSPFEGKGEYEPVYITKILEKSGIDDALTCLSRAGPGCEVSVKRITKAMAIACVERAHEISGSFSHEAEFNIIMARVKGEGPSISQDELDEFSKNGAPMWLLALTCFVGDFRFPWQSAVGSCNKVVGAVTSQIVGEAVNAAIAGHNEDKSPLSACEVEDIAREKALAREKAWQTATFQQLLKIEEEL